MQPVASMLNSLSLSLCLCDVDPVELQKCMFSDALVTTSEGGRELGEFSVTVEFASRAQQPCLLLHAHSHGAIDDTPCGTTVTGDGRRGGD